MVKKYALNIVLSLSSLLFAFMIGELTVRWFANFDYVAPRIFLKSQIIPWELKPNVQAIDEGYWREFHVSVKTNSLGYRDEEFSPEKPTGIFRILVLGDSFTFGYGVEGHEAYPKVLERLMNDGDQGVHCRYEVINAGYASGHAPDTSFVYFRHKGIRLKPDLVLLGYFEGNDIIDELYTQWPEVDSHGLPLRVTTDMYYIDTLGRLRTAEWLGLWGDRQNSWVSPFLRVKVALRDHSQFLNFLIQRYRLILLMHGKQAQFDNLPPIDTEEIKRAYQKIERVLTGLRMLASENGGQFVLLSIPSKGQLSGVQPTGASEFIRNWSKSTSTPLLDLGEELAQVRSDRLYFTIDPHWNARGHALAARAAYKHLQQIIRNAACRR